MTQLISLFLAIQSKDLGRLKQLLDEDRDLANAWRFDPIATPLHACVFNPKCAAVLLDYQADPNAIDNDDNRFTPVHACATIGDTETLLLLLENGGNVNGRCRWGAPLHLALGNGENRLADNYMAVMDVLIKQGADVNAPVDEDGSDQWSPLHQACSEGLLDAVELLVAHGAKVHLGKDGLTPLMVAQSMGEGEIEALLKKHGA